MGVDRTDLELLVATAETGSILGAARRLHIAQPALSRRLQRIEHEMGVQLFVRDRRGAALTAAGRSIFPLAKSALEGVATVEAAARDAREGVKGVIRLGTTPTLGADVLARLLAEHHRAHPDARVDLEVSGRPPDLVRALTGGRLDCVVAVRPARLPTGVRVAAEGRQPFVLLCGSGDSIAELDPIPRHLLVDLEFVSLPAGQGLRLLLDDVIASLGAVPRIGIETTEREMLVPLAAAGFGVTLVPRIFAEHRLVEGLELRRLDPPVSRRIGVLVRRGRLDPLVRTLTRLFSPQVWD